LIITASVADASASDEKSREGIEIRTVAKSTDAEYFAFPSLCRTKDGELLCVFFNGSSHICPDSKISMVRSKDNGKTWSKPVELPMLGQASRLLHHSSGVIFHTFRDILPSGESQGVAGIFAQPDKPWDVGKVFSLVRVTGDAAYPSSVELGDGSILTVFYAREHRAIQAALHPRDVIEALR
jgi:hypothetical protein